MRVLYLEMFLTHAPFSFFPVDDILLKARSTSSSTLRTIAPALASGVVHPPFQGDPGSDIDTDTVCVCVKRQLS